MKQFVFITALLISFCMISAALQAQTNVTITNQSGVTVTGVYLAPAGSAAWSPRLNTKDKIANNESFNVSQTIDKTKCNYDVKFSGEDGRDYFINNVSLCSNPGISLIMPVNSGNDNANKSDKVDEKTNNTGDIK